MHHGIAGLTRHKLAPVVVTGRGSVVSLAILLRELGQQRRTGRAVVLFNPKSVIPTYRQTSALAGRFNSRAHPIRGAKKLRGDGLHGVLGGEFQRIVVMTP
jgi:hypothetical protein